jgi:hypothetical protein
MTPTTPTSSTQRQAPRTATGAPDTSRSPLKIRVGSPTSLLAIIPGLLSFDPGHSIVVIGTDPGNGQVRLTLRYDVPDPAHPTVATGLATDAVSLLAAQGVKTAVAVGYGTDAEVAPVIAALREHATEAGIALTELLRAENQRYWSYICVDPACCPPEGTPFDVTRHPATRALRAAGYRVLSGRTALAASVAAKGGQPGAVMRRATKKWLSDIAQSSADAGIPAFRLVAAVGQVVVSDAIRRYRAGESVPLDHAALLTVALGQLRVRDDAWARMEPEHRDAHLRLWTDLTRLARPGFVAPAAALLAFIGWQSGDGALGNVALDRALADNPRYTMALLLRDALDSGAPPAMARLPMTPDEVAAAYDAAEAAPEAAPDDPHGPQEPTVAAGEAGRM